MSKRKRPLRAAKDVIIAVHGIRTFGEWNSVFSDLILSQTDYDYRYVNYWPFDAIDLLLPNPGWKRRKSQVLRLILQAKDEKKNISIIAHSFGTYLVTSILNERPELTIDNLILCGSIIKPELISEHLERQVKGLIINECGINDCWPPIAEFLSRSYSATGVRGFGGNVIDRFYKFGHSGFFTTDFVTSQWLPLFKGEQPGPNFRRGSVIERVYPWHIKFLMQLSSYRRKIFASLFATVVLVGSLNVFYNICIFYNCTIHMNLTRILDYEQSKCVGKQRLYSVFATDEILFNRFIPSYEARWYFTKDDDGRPVEQPPLVYEQGTPGNRVKQAEDKSHLSEPYYAYIAPVSWLRHAVIQWDFRGVYEEPRGMRLTGRYPIETLSIQIRLPKNMELRKCDTCKEVIDGVYVGNDSEYWKNTVRKNCTFSVGYTQLTCKNMNIPAEKPFIYRFQIQGWEQC